jgi:hypothetical protein
MCGIDAKWRRQGGCRGGSVDGWETRMCGIEAKWRRQGGCRGGSVDGWENGMCGIEAKSPEVEEAARGWS